MGKSNTTSPTIEESSTNPGIDRLLKTFKALKAKEVLKEFEDAEKSEVEVDTTEIKEKLKGINESILRILPEVNKMLTNYTEELRILAKKTLKRPREASRLSKNITSLTALKEGCEDKHFAITEILGKTPVMPSLSDFKREDSLLRNIYDSLSQYERAIDEEDKERALGQLYFAADYWLKVAAKPDEYGLEIDLRKKKEITRLYSKVVKALLIVTDVPSISKLPEYLESHFGKGMVEHGYKLDFEDEMANYLEKGDRDKFKTYVKGGKLYQRKWWEGSDKSVLADSSKTVPEGKDMGGRSGYIMSMSGDIYLARHKTPTRDEKGLGIYHSSYMKGMPILCAGEILITNGVVSVMNTRSGHYRPTDRNMVQALKVLKMIGVDISTIDVSTFTVPEPMKGDAFIEHIENSEDGPDELAEYIQNDLEQIANKQRIFKNKLLKEQKDKISGFRDGLKKTLINRTYGPLVTKKYSGAKDIIAYIKEKIDGEDDYTRDERNAGIQECKVCILHHLSLVAKSEEARPKFTTGSPEDRKFRKERKADMGNLPDVSEIETQYSPGILNGSVDDLVDAAFTKFPILDTIK